MVCACSPSMCPQKRLVVLPRFPAESPSQPLPSRTFQFPQLFQRNSHLTSAVQWKDQTSKLHATSPGPGSTSCAGRPPALRCSEPRVLKPVFFFFF